MMTAQQMEEQITHMGETLLTALENCTDPGNAKALYNEWIVDGRDPQDGKYEFIFSRELFN